MRNEAPPIQARILDGLAKLTWIIENHSEAAWPLFDRLEQELEQQQSRRSRLDRRRHMTK